MSDESASSPVVAVPMWPTWDLVKDLGWTAFTPAEWTKQWSYARQEAAKQGRRVVSHVTETTPWGALSWDWCDGPQGWDVYCIPCVATSLGEVVQVTEFVGRRMPTKWWAGGFGALVPPFWLAQTMGPHWWEIVAALAAGAAGWWGGRRIDARQDAAVRAAMSVDDLPIVMPVWRMIRTFEPRPTRWVFTAVSRLYGQLVIDAWGEQTHVTDSDRAQALQQMERLIEALGDLNGLGVLAEHRGPVEALLAETIPTAQTCQMIADNLERLREAVERQQLAAQAARDAAALPTPTISAQERALNQDHALQVTQAAALSLEEITRHYVDDAQALDAGRARIKALDDPTSQL